MYLNAIGYNELSYLYIYILHKWNKIKRNNIADVLILKRYVNSNC